MKSPENMSAADMYEQAVLWGTGQRSWTNMMVPMPDDPGMAVILCAQADAATAQGWLAAAQAAERYEALNSQNYRRIVK